MPEPPPLDLSQWRKCGDYRGVLGRDRGHVARSVYAARVELHLIEAGAYPCDCLDVRTATARQHARNRRAARGAEQHLLFGYLPPTARWTAETVRCC